MVDLSLADVGEQWFEDIMGMIIEWLMTLLTDGLERFQNEFFGTPLPEGSGASRVFGVPASSDEPWHSIYEAVVAGEVMTFALLLLFLSVQGRHFVRIFNFSNAYETRRTRRSAWTGAVLIVAWYWLGVLALYFAEGLTIGLLPDASTLALSLLGLLPTAAGNPLLTLVMASLGGFAMAALEALLFIRDVLLYVYLYGMPFGIAVAFGNLPILSRVARRLCLQFVPLAALPIPAAILLRGYELLFVGGGSLVPSTPFLQYFVVVSMPLFMLYVMWKTFSYASPMTVQVLGTTARAVTTVGVAAGIGYVAGPHAATTAARWGPRAGATQAATQRAFGQRGGTDSSDADRTNHDDSDEGGGNGGAPPYRRTENDPLAY
ncbi:MAG: hypothetical protein V5A27_03455 [Halapricum sp.]